MTTHEQLKLMCQNDELIKLLKSVKERLDHPLGGRERMYLINIIDEALKDCEASNDS